ncbi:hypothetical protein HK102_001634 [Quaeritorhiza haematococci]|nr:hypothetical protein HK102_001634 [Quaeritorhiza haematococci]
MAATDHNSDCTDDEQWQKTAERMSEALVKHVMLQRIQRLHKRKSIESHVEQERSKRLHESSRLFSLLDNRDLHTSSSRAVVDDIEFEEHLELLEDDTVTLLHQVMRETVVEVEGGAENPPHMKALPSFDIERLKATLDQLQSDIADSRQQASDLSANLDTAVSLSKVKTEPGLTSSIMETFSSTLAEQKRQIEISVREKLGNSKSAGMEFKHCEAVAEPGQKLDANFDRGHDLTIKAAMFRKDLAAIKEDMKCIQNMKDAFEFSGLLQRSQDIEVPDVWSRAADLYLKVFGELDKMKEREEQLEEKWKEQASQQVQEVDVFVDGLEDRMQKLFDGFSEGARGISNRTDTVKTTAKFLLESA